MKAITEKDNIRKFKEEIYYHPGTQGNIEKCQECGMVYNKTKKDLVFHKKYCNSRKEGVKIKKTYKNSSLLKRVVIRPLSKTLGKVILFHGSRARGFELKKLIEINEFINRKIDGIKLENDEIKNYKYLIYLNECDDVIGVLISEHVSAYKRLNFNVEFLCDIKKQEKMIIGVKRIWTLDSYRQLGIAKTLLSCLRNDVYYGISQLPLNYIAFSQPTNLGLFLVKSFFKDYGKLNIYT
ncbi:hypothetical protein K502DRAFT_343822 [Neoconidiobolus thromboides FSU 785]|nr:hypothetical protein K502DRAFT_343822 [Neoconidiobolus thromboides FSU 785]